MKKKRTFLFVFFCIIILKSAAVYGNYVNSSSNAAENTKPVEQADVKQSENKLSGYMPNNHHSLHNPDLVPTITREQINKNRPADDPNRDIIVLDFEGLGNVQQILDYYNGGYSGGGFGPGPNYGVTFSGSTLSIIAGYAGGTGNFQNEPSPVTVMFFLDEDNAIMSVESGFQDGFSFYYSSIQFSGSVEVYDELEGNGNLIASLELDPLGSLDIPGGAFNIWEPIGVSFEGVAKSVKFIGAANRIGFDDITFGSDTPGVPDVIGHVRDASTLAPIAGAVVTVEGISAITDAEGYYSIYGLPEGNLRAEFTGSPLNGTAPLEVSFTDLSSPSIYLMDVVAEGYSNYEAYHEIPVPERPVTINPLLSSELQEGELRFVLTWGADPRDLDSHLKTPNIQGQEYHIFYANRGSLTSPPYAHLDVDVVQGYGPETITIAELYQGTYRYFVHKYAGVGDIAGSNALVAIYDDNGLIQTIQAPGTGNGRYWHVANIDGATGNISIINQIFEQAPAAFEEIVKHTKKPEKISVHSKETEISSWSWSFGDGNTSSEQNPNHVFATPGVYDVSLTVESTAGETHTNFKDNYVIVSGTDPVPVIDVNPSSLNFGEVTVNTNSSPQSYILSWSNLSSDITVSSNSGHYKVAHDESGPFASSITVPTGTKTRIDETREPEEFLLFSNQSGIKQNINEVLHFYDSKPVVTRFQGVEISNAVKNISHIQKRDLLILNLFENAEYPSTVLDVYENINGTTVVTSKLDGFDYAYAISTTTGQRSLVNVYIPELQKYYQVISDPASVDHYVVEMNSYDRDILPDSPPLIPEMITPEDIEEQIRIRQELDKYRSGPNDPANVDVMIVYTPAAQTYANNNGGGIQNVVAQSMANAQLVLNNSQTIMSVTLVHSAQVNYTESGSSGADLRRFTASPDFNPFGDTWNGYTIPGFMDEIHDWRDNYGADLCALFSYVEDTGGVAWLLNTTDGLPSAGFSITRIQQAATSYTHIHEMGHNMGLDHHKQQNVQPGPGLFSYSAGWRWQAGGSWYNSVMAYSGGQFYVSPAPGAGITSTEVPHFSNPSITHLGVPTGHASNGDNARSAREIKHVIAAYRPSASQNQETIWVRFEPGTTGTLNGIINNSASNASANVDLTGTGMPYTDGSNIMLIRDATASTNGVVTIELEIINQDEFVGFNLDIPLPEGFSYIDGTAQLYRDDGHFVSFGIIADNVARILSAAIPTKPFLGNEGVILSFDLQTPAQVGDYTFCVVDAIIVDENGVNIMTNDICGTITLEESSTVTFNVTNYLGTEINNAIITFGGIENPAGNYVFDNIETGTHFYTVEKDCYLIAEGSVTVNAPNVNVNVVLDNILGDANNDGVVNVSDVVVIVNFFMGQNPDPFCFINADVNADGVINVSDVVGATNIFMGGKISPYEELTSEKADIYLYPDGIYLESDGTLTAIQFEMKGENIEELSMAIALSTHQLIYSDNDKNLIAMAFSISNAPIPAGKIRIIDFEPGGHQLQWGQVLAANLNAEAVTVVTHSDEATDVSNIEGLENIQIYPNPAKDVLWVEFVNKERNPMNISLINIHGQLIKHHTINESGPIKTSLDIKELPAGTFILRLESTYSSTTRKIIIK